ncbi:MAG: FAD-dependent oxidoreductase [Bacteroidales bacterium]|jgi:thioredoxin reductase (NADPH)
MNEIFDVAIIGGGPAGLSAGIYSSRAKLKTVILNSGSFGGQVVLTDEVANYPGVEQTKGFNLAAVMKKQAKDFGCKLIGNIEITEYHLNDEIKKIVLSDGREIKARGVIFATGGRPRLLGVEGENEFRGRGISFCATCDGDFFTGKEVVVVGGGNSALEEAISLTKFATKVTIVHQFDHFQAFPAVIDEAKKTPKLNFIMESRIVKFLGSEKLEAVEIEHITSGTRHIFKTDGVFIFIGYIPNTEDLKGILPLNDRGEIIVDSDMFTGIPGVYAAGDSIAKKYRQITTAVAEGTIASLSLAEYIKSKVKIFEDEKNLVVG